jgi:hypothetical protein
MRTHWLITTATVALLASAGTLAAQGMNERGGRAPGAAMERNAPADEGRSSRGMQSERNGASQRETTGQAPGAQQPSGATQRDMRGDRPGTAGQAPNAQQQERSAQPQQQERSGAQQRQQSGTEQNRQSGTEQNRQSQDSNRGRSETTGRGDASGARLTTQQRTKIREVVVSKKIPRVTNVNFSISVGAVVPRTVEFYPIPVEIVEVYPTWRGYRVILVGGQLIIVHPSSYRIVAVIPV